MSLLDAAMANLLTPAILCFALGVFAVWLRSDLHLPEPVFAALSMFLMLSIGLRGGVEIAHVRAAEIAAPLAGAFLLGCSIPLWCYAFLRRVAGLGVPDAAALAAHYGSVSAVTFAAVTTFLDRQGVGYEGYASALLAVMEVPAIVVAIGLARVAGLATAPGPVAGGAMALNGGGPDAGRTGLAGVVNEVLSSRSIVLLAGGLAIGALSGPEGFAKVKPLFGDLFQGALCLFLLDLGRMAASRMPEFRRVGPVLAAFAVIAPVLHAILGALVAHATGLSQGGAVVLATLAASASYIAAPAAVRLALPEANPGYYLTCSLAITFPFNIIVGLPLYAAIVARIYG